MHGVCASGGYSSLRAAPESSCCAGDGASLACPASLAPAPQVYGLYTEEVQRFKFGAPVTVRGVESGPRIAGPTFAAHRLPASPPQIGRAHV